MVLWGLEPEDLLHLPPRGELRPGSEAASGTTDPHGARGGLHSRSKPSCQLRGGSARNVYPGDPRLSIEVFQV
jgi:hypothetical protein